MFMVKIVFVLFLLFFVLPSVWSYFYNKKLSKNIKPSVPLTDEQMQALLQPDGKPKLVKKQNSSAPKKPVQKSVEKPVVKQAPHEVQSIILKREIYY